MEDDYKDALEAILACDRLDVAKEIAADVLGYDLEEYLEEYDVDTSFDDDEGVTPKDVLAMFE